MEIADIFVVNKSDRPDADRFVNNLRLMMAPAFSQQERTIPVIKTIADKKEGIQELKEAIRKDAAHEELNNDRKVWLLTNRVMQIIQRLRMKDVQPAVISEKIREELATGQFNLFRIASQF